MSWCWNNKLYLVCLYCICVFNAVLIVLDQNYLKYGRLTLWTTRTNNTECGDTSSVSQEIRYDTFLSPDEVGSWDVPATNCQALFDGDRDEVARAIEYQTQHLYVPPSDYEIMARARNCTRYVKTAQYVTKPVSREEAEFPIAYSIMMYKNPVMVERMIRAIYRPQNYYCIHVDLKANRNIYGSMKALANCFDNVFITRKRVSVDWSGYTELEPDFFCMEIFWKYKDWKYFINLTGEEFPLRTNLELVRILKMFNGSNNVPAQTKRPYRFRYQTYYINGTTETGIAKPPPPINVTLAKESVHVALVRGSVDFILHDKGALAFREWSKTTWFPDEMFFASLNLSPHLKMPGAYTGNVEFDAHSGRNQYVVRLKIWNYDGVKCHGRFQRTICLMSVGHLKDLGESPRMFVNKFKQGYHPLAHDCMEQRIFHNVLREASGQKTYLNESYYQSMDFVKNHV